MPAGDRLARLVARGACPPAQRCPGPHSPPAPTPTVAKLATRWCQPRVRPPAEARAVRVAAPALPVPTALPEAPGPPHTLGGGRDLSSGRLRPHTGVPPGAGDSGPAPVPTAPCSHCIPIPPGGRLRATRAADLSHPAALGSELVGLVPFAPRDCPRRPPSTRHPQGGLGDSGPHWGGAHAVLPSPPGGSRMD